MHDEASHIQTRLDMLEHAIQAMQPAKACACSVAPDARRVQHAERTGRFVQEDRLQIIKAFLDGRRLRTRYFDQDLFFDPAWSILIDLYRAELTGEQLSVSSVCYGSGVAETTALRYVKVLELRGFIERKPDPKDRRRFFLGLHRSAFDKLDRYFADVSNEWASLLHATGNVGVSKPMARYG